MAAAGLVTFTNSARTYLLNGTLNPGTDNYNIALFTSASNLGSGSTTYATLTGEVANGNGYATGGKAITISLSGTTTVTVTASTPVSWVAAGGSIQAYYAAVYKVNGAILFYFTLKSPAGNIDVTDTNTLAITADAAGFFTLS